jgi:hypothetical protein
MTKIIHIAADYDYTVEDIQQIMGMVQEAMKDPDGAGVVFTRNDVRISVIDVPEKIGSLVVAEVSDGPTGDEVLDFEDEDLNDEDFDDEGSLDGECTFDNCEGCESCEPQEDEDGDEDRTSR